MRRPPIVAPPIARLPDPEVSFSDDSDVVRMNSPISSDVEEPADEPVSDASDEGEDVEDDDLVAAFNRLFPEGSLLCFFALTLFPF